MRIVTRQPPTDPAVSHGKNILSFPRHVAKPCAGGAVRSGRLARLTAALLLRRRRDEAVRRLLSLDDRMLADIGLLPDEPRGVIERWRSGRWRPDRRHRVDDPSTGTPVPDRTSRSPSFDGLRTRPSC